MCEEEEEKEGRKSKKRDRGEKRLGSITSRGVCVFLFLFVQRKRIKASISDYICPFVLFFLWHFSKTKWTLPPHTQGFP